MTTTTQNIRNIAVVGHQGAGKTTLVEALAFATGAVSRIGRVEDGNTVSDFHPEERDRGMSINTSLVSLTRNELRINLLDTPGYADFVGEVVSAVAVADAAIVVVDASSGVQVGTETAWRLARRRGIPRAVVITRLDRENSSWDEALESAQRVLGPECQPLFLPIGAESDFSGSVAVLTGRAYTGDGQDDSDPPPDAAQAAAAAREGLIERIVEADEELMLAYLEDEELDDDALADGLKPALLSGALAPVLPACAAANIGAWPLLRLIESALPNPAEAPAIDDNLAPDSQTDPAAFIFKTTADEFVGRLSYLRVAAGTIRGDSHLQNARQGDDERLAGLSHALGKDLQIAADMAAGDLGVVTKLSNTTTFDTLRAPGSDLLIAPPEMPAPIFAAAVEPRSKADVDKLGPSLTRLVEEDPTLRIERDRDSGETILSGLGESHVQLAADQLLRKFKVEVDIRDRRVPYRETVTAVGQAEYLHKKQTGGHGQYARVALRVEPRERGAGFEFGNEIVGGAVPRNYIPAVEKGVVEALPAGAVASYPLTDVRVVLYDGKHHDVDSSEMAFKLAASQALREATGSARPILLEPIQSYRILVPDQSTGDVISDLNARRARVLGMEQADDPAAHSYVLAEGPMAEFLHYATDLRSMTGGRGTFAAQFERYDPVPEHVAQKVRQQTETTPAS